MCVLCSVTSEQSGFMSVDAGSHAAANPTGVGGTGIRDVDALIFGGKWDAKALTYSFPTYQNYYTFFGQAAYAAPTREDFRSDANLFWDAALGYQQATAAQEGAVTYILKNLFESVCGLTFQQIPDTGTYADLAFARTTNFNTALGGVPSLVTGLGVGDVWFGSAKADLATPLVGDYGWATIIHEIGHALGLRHGHSSGPTSGWVQPLASMTPEHDRHEYSIMTYRSYKGAPTDGYKIADGSFATSLMMYDIRALQHLYGANFGHNAGSTVYEFNPTTGAYLINGQFQLQSTANKVLLTIWDGDGIDTYNFSNYRVAQKINLNPGAFSVLSTAQLANLGNGNVAQGNVYNALTFGSNRSLIENAKAGSASDTVVGNAINNTLWGNSGNDVLSGIAGNDTLLGGAGSDRLVGGLGKDILVGGTQADRFEFNSVKESVVGTNRDVVTFVRTERDKIDLFTVDADTDGTSGNQKFVWIGSKVFSGVDGQLRFAGGILAGDTNGDRKADFEIQIKGALTAADVIL